MIRLTAFTGLLAAAVLAGCAGAGPEAGGAASAAGLDLPADTASGVVAILGADPATMVAIQTLDADGRVIASRGVDGAVVDTLRALEGVRVWVAGTRRGERLDVVAFRVRGLGDLPAADGVLERDGDVAVLRTPDGDRIRYTPAPPSLLALVGRRVWIAGPAGGEPSQWGLLER